MPFRVDVPIIAKPRRKDRGFGRALPENYGTENLVTQDKRNGPANPRDAEPFQFRTPRLACAALEVANVGCVS